MSDMKRREFITLVGGAAAAWPLAARAQQGERMRRIGVLMHLASDDPEGQARIGAFLQGLQEWGWAVGRNLRIEYRWAAGDAERIRKSAAELVALAPSGAVEDEPHVDVVGQHQRHELATGATAGEAETEMLWGHSQEGAFVVPSFVKTSSTSLIHVKAPPGSSLDIGFSLHRKLPSAARGRAM
jgi:hypothetical protein